MNLNRISIQARPRSPWEAVDLGFVMTRQWWVPVFLSWFIPSFTVFIALSVLFSAYPWVAYVAVWWLKPLWDRGPLYIASRQLFGESVSLHETLLQLPKLYKVECFQWLSFRRFSFTRSFDMPLTVLEMLKGDQRSSRQSVLHRHHSNAATWLTIVAFHLEAIIALGLVTFVVLMIPESVEVDYLGILLGEETMVIWAEGILAYVAMTLVGPFYSLSGFALYVSRRIDLEAWDIEIRFRHLAEKAKSKKETVGLYQLTGLIAPILLVGSLCFFSADLKASDESSVELKTQETLNEQSSEQLSDTALQAQAAKEEMIDILKGDEFHRVETVSGWRLKKLDEPEEEGLPEWLLALIEYLEGQSDSELSSSGGLSAFFAFVAVFIELILWGVAVFIVALVIYKYRALLKKLTQLPSSRADEVAFEVPSVMFGLDVSAESIPDDIPSAVRDLWEKEEYRESVGLLYRALLSGLIHRHGFKFSDGHTEGECLSIVKKSSQKELSRYSQKITQCWQKIAYGHLIPDVNEVAGLCRDWEAIFPHE